MAILGRPARAPRGRRWISSIALASLLLAWAPGRCPAQDADGTRYGISKQMRMAIEMYEKGDDLDAMDRFMEILVKGDPAERPMANQYLNLITQRMAIGSKIDGRPPSGPAVIEQVGPRRPVVVEESVDGAPRRGAPPTRLDPVHEPERSVRRLSKSDREMMKREIEGKIRNRTRVLLQQLRKYQDLRVRMANSRLPRAIGIPSSLIYSSGVQFRKESAKILETLTHLVFSLGATQVVLLPERAVLGDAKILDMRRTMGISSHLLKAGIAPARVRANLLSSQVDIPRDMRDFEGMLLLFVYNQPLTLTADTPIGAERGPPVSLGVSPSLLDPRKGEGSIIEFSVMDPPAGLMIWRFQLVGPGAKPGSDMVVLQEVKGSAPVFHQIYWNGRRKYFGPPLPAGRYECVLSATDMRNRTHKRHSWITVEGPAPVAAAKPKSARRPAAVEDMEAPRPSVRRKTIKRRPKRRKKPRRRTKRRKRKVASKTIRSEPSRSKPLAAKGPPDASPAAGGGGAGAAPAASPPGRKSARSGTVNYKVEFNRNTANVTAQGENIIGYAADAMHYYPLDNINLVGYAYSGESVPGQLATRRADLVERLLKERHGMADRKFQKQTKVVEHESFKVEIYIVQASQ